MKTSLSIPLRLFLLGLLAACGPQTNTPVAKQIATGMAPHLAVSPDGIAVVSYIANTEEGNELRYRTVRDGIWSGARSVADGNNWFVNWADFPSVEPIAETLWAAHWLVRRKAGGYAYDVYASVSEDAGDTWAPPFLLHNDQTDTEHGFVTLFPTNDRIGAIWLDGRNMAGNNDSATAHSSGGMTLRTGQFSARGVMSNEQVVDDLTCDCCQTDIAITDAGPVAVYRNRTTAEVRDIYISRFEENQWQSGQPVHDDGWVISGCPVNGPVVKASGSTVAVTWLTSAGDRPTVKMAWSHDSGRSFDPAIVVANDGAIGYVGSALVSGKATASWLCKDTSSRNSICYRTVQEDGALGPVKRVETHSVVSRMSVPQLASIDDQLLFVWTEKIEGEFQIHSATVAL